MSRNEIGSIGGRALLALLFFGLVSPVALCLRLVGYRPLALRFDRAASTYWLPAGRDERDPLG